MYKTQYTLKKQFYKKNSSPDFVARNTDGKKQRHKQVIKTTAKNHGTNTLDFSSLFILLIFHLKGKRVSGTKKQEEKSKTVDESH